MRSRLVGSVLSFLFALATPALAQQGTSEIGGRVVDDQGGVLPGVTIVLTNEETGLFREVTSGADGSYFASQLTPGRYRLSAKLASFRTFERQRPGARGRQDADDRRDDGASARSRKRSG